MKTKKYFLLLIALCFFSTNCLAAGAPLRAPAATSSESRKALSDKVKMLLAKGVAPSHWLRHPQLQQVFNKASWNFNFFKFLTPKQKDLLKKDAEAVNQALDKSEIASKSKVSSPSTIAEVSRTYLLIYALAMSSIVKEKLVYKYKSGTDFEYKATFAELGSAFMEVLDSGEIIAAMGSAGATHAVLAKPLNFLQAVIQDKKLFPMFKNFMVYFSHTLVSFTGWEFGAQLWKEATFLLDSQITDPEERKFLQDRNKIFTNIIHTIAIPLDSGNAKQKATAAKMLGLTISNVVKIIILDSDLRIQWLYNSLRLRMMNGHFVTLVGAMSSASTIGTALVPGAGTLVGLTFGFFGGVGTILITEENKNGITNWMKESWKSTLDSTSGNSTFKKLNLDFTNANKPKDGGIAALLDVLGDRVAYREKYVDIYIERIFNNSLAITQNLEKIVKYAKVLQSNPNNQSSKEEMADLMDIVADRYQSTIDAILSLVSLYATESQLFDGFKTRSAPEFSEELNIQVVLSENMYSHFCSFTKSYLTIDLLDNYSRALTSFPKMKQLMSLCKIDKIETKRAHANLDPTAKENFDAAARFIDKSYWTKYNETEIAVERMSELLLLPN